jgi:hypothetical protein
MNRDDIIKIALEALKHKVDYKVWTLSTPHLARFAELVAAAEREACAKVCEEFYSIEGIAQRCAYAIRARKD